MLIITNEIEERIINDITQRALNNKDHQTIVHPSDYGFRRNTEVTYEFISYLEKILPIEKIKFVTHDMIDVTLKK